MKNILPICVFVLAGLGGCTPHYHSIMTDSSGVLRCPDNDSTVGPWSVTRQAVVMHTIHYRADEYRMCYAEPFPGPATNDLVEACYFAYAYAGSCENLTRIHTECMRCWSGN